ncbi:hypothetical protein BPTFM16_02614 [Altererythrobacter insulae]|nr:hypothetical protein BPTFM16_02614 [Altererythrobacter insulae]
MQFRSKLLAAALFSSLLIAPVSADSSSPLSLAKLVAQREANEGRVGTMHFELKNKAGRSRQRTALMVHSDKGSVEQIAIYFMKPSMIENTAFLSHNHTSRADQNWLYLPATDRVRRLPVSERSDYFMGTDLTYGDLQDNFKFDLGDWNFVDARQGKIGGKTYPLLEGVAKTRGKAAEMGYSGFKALIDQRTGFPVWTEYTDVDGEPLKRIRVYETKIVGGAHTAMRFSIHNIQTGHTTLVHFTNMRHVPNLDDSVLSSKSLAYGVPSIN